MLPYLGSSDLGTEVALFLCDSRLGCWAETVPLDESIQHGLRGHGALGEGGLPEGVLAHGLPGQPGGRVLVQQLHDQVLEIWRGICGSIRSTCPSLLVCL